MDGSINQFPEQAARDNIDKQLRAAGWAVQDKDKIDWNESTGILIRSTDYRDPKPRSRPVFTFHRPETFKAWLKEGKSLRARLLDIPELPEYKLRDCQIKAINNLEKSFKENKPRSLVQMATGAGKTYTAITSNYRLLKFAGAKRILFLVDTKNLGEQAEQEFMAYQPSDELDEETEEKNEINWEPKEPMPVVYDAKIPIEQFDFIVIDECHRSIYNLWKQVLDYFDAFLIGLTATPDKRTFGFFNDVYIIETEISQHGAKINAREFVDKRERLSRRKRWEQLDEDISYSKKDLDKDIVNPSQIRNIIRAFKNKLPEIFPGRKEDPKSILTRFRNAYNPRIAVTVAMISVGIDVKPLECLLFMRDVKSKGYFEQMKENIAASFHIEVDDLDYTPFDAHGGRGMMFRLFGTGMNTVISDMNEALAI